MTKLPGAKPSPRIAGGVLRWYAGDTFSVTLALELRDQDGETVAVGASDSLTVRFFDASHAPVHTFQFDCVTGGQATLTIRSAQNFRRVRISMIFCIRTATKRRLRGTTARRQSEVRGCGQRFRIRLR